MGFVQCSNYCAMELKRVWKRVYIYRNTRLLELKWNPIGEVEAQCSSSENRGEWFECLHRTRLFPRSNPLTGRRDFSQKRGPLSRTFCWESGIKCFEEPVVPPFVELLQVFAVKARYRCLPRIYIYIYTTTKCSIQISIFLFLSFYFWTESRPFRLDELTVPMRIFHSPLGQVFVVEEWRINFSGRYF